jgi:hypothetical protein
MKKATKYVEKKQRSCRLNQTPPIANTSNPPPCLWQFIWSVNPAWMSLPSGLLSLKRKSELHAVSIIWKGYLFMLDLCKCHIQILVLYLQDPTWYLEIFICLDFNPWYFIYVLSLILYVNKPCPIIDFIIFSFRNCLFNVGFYFIVLWFYDYLGVILCMAIGRRPHICELLFLLMVYIISLVLVLMSGGTD